MSSPPATPNGFLASSRVKTMRPDRSPAPGRWGRPVLLAAYQSSLRSQSRRKLSVQGSGGLILSMPTSIEHRTASQTGRTPGPALSRNPLNPQPNSHVACAYSLIKMFQPTAIRPARFVGFPAMP